jgi:hypothetical protein
MKVYEIQTDSPHSQNLITVGYTTSIQAAKSWFKEYFSKSTPLQITLRHVKSSLTAQDWADLLTGDCLLAPDERSCTVPRDYIDYPNSKVVFQNAAMKRRFKNG